MSNVKKVGILPTDPYRRYLPSAFDESMNIYEQIITCIEYVNNLGISFNELVDWLDKVVLQQNEKLKEQDQKIDKLRDEWHIFEDYIVNILLKEKVVEILKEWLADGTLAEIINKDVFDMKADTEWVKSEFTKRGVHYKDFGAKLDGVTDDSDAIIAAHNYANEHNYPVIVKNEKFVLNKNVTVKTSTDLTGSVLTTTYVDPEPIEYNRTFNLFNIEGAELIDLSTRAINPEFIKGATRIPSLKNQPSGALIIKTEQTDIIRDNGGVQSNIMKAECNIMMKNQYGDLAYPLTKNYVDALKFQVFLRPFEHQLEFKFPKVEVKGRIYGIAKVHRNNTSFSGLLMEEINPSATISSIYTLFEYEDCADMEATNISCPIIGREVKTGENGLGYFLLMTRSAKFRGSNLQQISGWSGINGNWMRDISVVDSNMLVVGGHANVYDLTVDRSVIQKNIIAHGGGVIQLLNSQVIGSASPPNNLSGTGAVQTRWDYDGEFEGEIIVENVVLHNASYVVEYSPSTYNCGRTIVLPKTTIRNVHMRNLLKKKGAGVWFRGYRGEYAGNYPQVAIDSLSWDFVGTYTTRFVEFESDVANSLATNKDFKFYFRNIHPPRLSYGDVFNPITAFIHVPKVTNNDTVVYYDIQNCTVNMGLGSTANLDVTIDNSDFYAVNLLAPESVTTNGQPAFINVKNSTVHRGVTNFNVGANTYNRVRLTIASSIFKRLRKTDGSYDPQIGFPIEDFVSYTADNIADARAEIRGDNSARLFGYIDEAIWKIKKDPLRIFV
ncbi:pre-neck appendage protein [Bacillus phage DK2]|uniref:Pre-neck appendage protein n=1 Tax=Bacillus phage DK2 TaxID=2500809 RepID=A0A3T0IIY3_9CAUD|nr:tail spike protein [Bacillus phage DK2]AZU99787.1 pre-neck appendage protein [Bacillus phage DK2]